MSLSYIIPELMVIGLAMVILLLDLWTPDAAKPRLGYLAILGLIITLGCTFGETMSTTAATGFSGELVHDGLGIFFDRFFLVAAIFVIVMAMDFADRIPLGIAEFYVLVLLALSGMMFSAAANEFMLMFVAVELLTVTFYVLVSYQRARLWSLEAGVKYLVMGGLSTAFLVFGIALVFASSDVTNFSALSNSSNGLAHDHLFWLGLVLVLVGLSFKVSVFPMQMWTPDVYQGAPTPVTAFLAVASKAAGFSIVLRVLFVAVPYISRTWAQGFMVVAGITILYGNLCAIPQRNLKRLLGYSSIAHAGYLMLGIAALNRDGSAAILYYLVGYLFTLGAVFVVIGLVCRETDDIDSLNGLHQRSPVLAGAMALGMISLAGLPPMAGFAGKLLLIRSALEQASSNSNYYWLAFVAIAGVVISIYYYLGVVRAIYWKSAPVGAAPIPVKSGMKICLAVCVVGMIYLGFFPDSILNAAADAVKVLRY